MPNQIRIRIQTCKKHGATEHVLERRGYFRCKKCRSEAVTNNRKERKRKLVEYFGGKCELCGYSRSKWAMHFHHRDPSTKEFAISDFGVCRSWERMLVEAK